MFEALDDGHLNVHTLSIENLQDYSPGVYTTQAFRNVRDRLESLHLKISMEWSEHGPDVDIDIEEKHNFFNHELNTHWLEPLQSRLIHLTIYANNFFGVYPRWDPRALHFPRLSSLSFGKWSIAHQWQIDWLLAHGQTLEGLYLDDCPIVHALRFFDYEHRLLSWEPNELFIDHDGGGFMYPSLRWPEVLSRFSNRLKRLRKFGMMRSTSWADCSHNHFCDYEGCGAYEEAFRQRYGIDARLEVGRYMHFDPGTCPTPWIQDCRAESDDKVDQDSVWKLDWESEGIDTRKLEYPKGREKEEAALKALLEEVKTHTT